VPRGRRERHERPPAAPAEGGGQKAPAGKPILELNPHHPLVQRLKDESRDDRVRDWLELLVDQAVLAEGGQLEDPGAFVKRLNAMLLEVGR